jgi:hypothetical protein
MLVQRARRNCFECVAQFLALATRGDDHVNVITLHGDRVNRPTVPSRDVADRRFDEFALFGRQVNVILVHSRSRLIFPVRIGGSERLAYSLWSRSTCGFADPCNGVPFVPHVM